LLIDDERLARKRLRSQLDAFSGIEIVGEAGDVAAAARACVDLRPDLLFLDVEMPRQDGFSLLPHLQPPLPRIVFVTAFDEYAVRAFDINALDYLLKPVRLDRLSRTIEKVRSALAEGAKASSLPDALRDSDALMLDDGVRMRMSRLEDIAAVAAEGNYTQVWEREQSPMLILRPLADWDVALPSPPFLRAGRSLIVNVSRILEIATDSRDRTRLRLQGIDREFVLGRPAAARVRGALRRRTGPVRQP
jgi:two-component system, LytTR family, response regulator